MEARGQQGQPFDETKKAPTGFPGGAFSTFPPLLLIWIFNMTTSSSSPALITRNFNGVAFTFRADGYFNMTKAAKHFGKRVDNFLANAETAEYMDELSRLVPGNAVTSIQKGSGLLPTVGTWAHPKLAVFFARWLDVRFAVWCDAAIEDILKGNAVAAMETVAKAWLEIRKGSKGLDLFHTTQRTNTPLGLKLCSVQKPKPLPSLKQLTPVRLQGHQSRPQGDYGRALSLPTATPLPHLHDPYRPPTRWPLALVMGRSYPIPLTFLRHPQTTGRHPQL